MNNQQKKSFYKKKSWRLWLVKKLLRDHIAKEEIYSIISHFFEDDSNVYESDNKNINDNTLFYIKFFQKNVIKDELYHPT